MAIDEGPYLIPNISKLGMFMYIRQLLGGYDLAANGQPKTNLGRLVVCPHCLGLWIALPLSLLTDNWLLMWFAIAGLQSFMWGLNDY